MMRDAVRELCEGQAVELPRRADRESHFLIADGRDLLRLCKWASRAGYYLCTLVADDERLLEDKVFKIYLVLSSGEGESSGEELATLEHHVRDEGPERPPQYPSVRRYFRSAAALEEEAFDMFGLTPINPEARGRSLLHSPPYPAGLRPLRTGRPVPFLRERIEAGRDQQDKHDQHDRQGEHGEPSGPTAAPPSRRLPEGVMLLPVGPIHAGIIEAGRFTFRVAGEVIEEVAVRLGYKHKGVEKLFETNYTLEDGWALAERVSGDSSFAHSMAYCQAVESLAGVEVPEEAHLWRALFLELERIYNHVGDVAALVHDIAFDLLDSRLSVLREEAVALNAELTGHRLLRGVNRPGGVALRPFERLEGGRLRRAVAGLTGQFLELSKAVAHMPSCRDRMIMTGVLTAKDARRVGATGFALRASQGWDKTPAQPRLHDFRTRHPQGAYKLEEIAELVKATVAPDGRQPSEVDRRLPIFWKDLHGDVFARMLLRIAEVETSAKIIDHVARRLEGRAREGGALAEVGPLLRSGPSYDFGIGHVEGWRGDVVYWVMKGPGDAIFRCKVRDPSLFNWPAVARAAERKRRRRPDAPGHYENLLADFPLINKSFNLSYSGHDL